MTLGDPLDEAMTFLRNTIAASPEFGSLPAMRITAQEAADAAAASYL